MNRTETNWPLAVTASPEDAIATLRACISPASFWAPEQIGPQPPWLEHAPFAFWLIEALRPRMLVELGTHGGFSYLAFCETVQRCGLDTRCYTEAALPGKAAALERMIGDGAGKNVVAPVD